MVGAERNGEQRRENKTTQKINLAQENPIEMKLTLDSTSDMGANQPSREQVSG